MENINALDNTPDATERSYMVSRLRGELARKYTVKRFVAYTDKSREALSTLAQFLVCCATVAYFYAQFIAYIVTDHYKSVSMIIHH